jgi:hypothetical protein
LGPEPRSTCMGLRRRRLHPRLRNGTQIV